MAVVPSADEASAVEASAEEPSAVEPSAAEASAACRALHSTDSTVPRTRRIHRPWAVACCRAAALRMAAAGRRAGLCCKTAACRRACRRACCDPSSTLALPGKAAQVVTAACATKATAASGAGAATVACRQVACARVARAKRAPAAASAWLASRWCPRQTPSWRRQARRGRGGRRRPAQRGVRRRAPLQASACWQRCRLTGREKGSAASSVTRNYSVNMPCISIHACNYSVPVTKTLYGQAQLAERSRI